MSRKENKHQQPQQGEDTLVDRQKRAKPHVSFSNITTPCSTPSSTSPPKPSGPVRTTWRRNLLHEEAMGSDSKESVSSPIEDAQSLTTMSHCSRQSTVLHHSTQRDNQPSSPSHGQSCSGASSLEYIVIAYYLVIYMSEYLSTRLSNELL